MFVQQKIVVGFENKRHNDVANEEIFLNYINKNEWTVSEDTTARYYTTAEFFIVEDFKTENNNKGV